MQSDSPQISSQSESTPAVMDTIATDLQSIETELAALKVRYLQVQADEAQRATLKAQQAELQEGTGRSDEIKTELEELTAQLDEVEMRLESRLLSWLGIRQYFWQIVRFGGLGLLLGWGLAYLAYEQKGFKGPNPELSPIEQRR
jgi:hypothetical protein